MSDSKIHEDYVKGFIAGNACPPESDKSLSAPYKLKDDPRVTRVGRALRKTSLDELPQFINVLKGHVSLVGPRPPFPSEFQSYDLEAKPGITGLWHNPYRLNLYRLKPLEVVALLFFAGFVCVPSPSPRQVISTPLPQDQRSARRQDDRTCPTPDRFSLGQPHAAPIAVETYPTGKQHFGFYAKIKKLVCGTWPRGTIEAN